MASFMAQVVKNLPAMQETQVPSLSWEDLLEKRMTTICSVLIYSLISDCLGFSGGSDGKEFACNAGDPGSIPGLGRSPGVKNGYPLQYSCLENSVNRGAWWATVHGIAKSWTQLHN